MKATTVTFLDVTLAQAEDENGFMAWWREALPLLQARVKPVRLELLVHGRGSYSVVIETQLPGGFKLIAEDRPWRELEAQRPAGRVALREARIWGERDVTTESLKLWLEDRAGGGRDFVLVDALPAADFAKKHIPGAVNLPAATIGPDTAAAALGADLGRTIVIYCAGYT
jgi:hypothetical protein